MNTLSEDTSKIETNISNEIKETIEETPQLRRSMRLRNKNI